MSNPSQSAPDDGLPPEEATDSDELRNDDGDETVTAPERWLAPEVASLDDRLDAEEPELSATEPAQPDQTAGRRHYGQVSGSPEDGDSFFPAQ